MFISRHTLKWTKTCRSSGDFPHAHTAHFLLNRHMRISHECLYRWIHAKPQRALGLRRYLPRSKRHRTRSKGRKARGPRIPMRVPITDRPKKVDSRHLQAIVREINDTPHEGPGLGNAQRGLVPQARQGNVKDKPPKDECCTYKLNPGRREVIPIASDKFVVK